MTAAEQGSTVYADRFYEMDPAFEDLIRGDQLRDGMIVLLQDGMMRGAPERAAGDDLMAKYEKARCRETARWCTVSEIRAKGDLISFLGIYADGTKYPRTYHRDFWWIVKADAEQVQG